MRSRPSPILARTGQPQPMGQLVGQWAALKPRRCWRPAAFPGGAANRYVSLKPYVLLFDEYYTELYRMTEAEAWMNGASRMVFIGTSFSVNITAIALRVAVQRGIPVEIVDPEPIDLAASFGIPAGMSDISYHRMKAQAWVATQG